MDGKGGGGEVPEENVLAMGNPAMKFFWVNKNLMKFKDTILMCSKCDKYLILTPRGLVESVLNLAHNVPSGGGGGGHQGVNLIVLKRVIAASKLSNKLTSLQFLEAVIEHTCSTHRSCYTLNLNRCDT